MNAWQLIVCTPGLLAAHRGARLYAAEVVADTAKVPVVVVAFGRPDGGYTVAAIDIDDRKNLVEALGPANAARADAIVADGARVVGYLVATDATRPVFVELTTDPTINAKGGSA